jgi:putative ABC transport system permease protein
LKLIFNWKLLLSAAVIMILAATTLYFGSMFLASNSKMTVTLNKELFLPKLNGQFKVGETTVYMADNSRPALPGLSNRREWVVTIYYPAIPDANASAGPYAEQVLNSAYTDIMLTKDSTGALDRIHSNAFWNASAVHSAGKFPVLLFSPGGGEQPLFYSSLLEQISSFGYIVVAIPEPFDTPVIPLPDGRILTKTQLDEWCKQNEICKKAKNGDKAAIDEITSVMKDDRARDMIFTLTELERINLENPLLAGIFDFGKVGAFGHSYGGASSVRIAQLDDRVDAVAILDSDIFYVIPQDSKPLHQPIMYLTASNIDESPEGLAAIGESNALANTYFSQSSPYYFVNIAGTSHQSFQTDAMFLAPYITVGGAGVTLYSSDTTPERITLVITNYVLAFFDQHLNGFDQPLLASPSNSYPEVTLRIKK